MMNWFKWKNTNEVEADSGPLPEPKPMTDLEKMALEAHEEAEKAYRKKRLVTLEEQVLSVLGKTPEKLSWNESQKRPIALVDGFRFTFYAYDTLSIKLSREYQGYLWYPIDGLSDIGKLLKKGVVEREDETNRVDG